MNDVPHQAPRGAHQYYVYGVTVTSAVPLGLPTAGPGELGSVDIALGASAEFTAASAELAASNASPLDWCRHVLRADGTSYVRWETVGEFLVSADGTRVRCLPEARASRASFEVYLVGQALSFALVKQGFEPLHATAVLVDGRAVALLGDSGAGKSTLAAAFHQAGYGLLTDDVLVLRVSNAHVVAYPGPGRLKLFPKLAGAMRLSLDDATSMNGWSPKVVLPARVEPAQAAVELAALYLVAPPPGTPGAIPVHLEAVPPQRGAIEIIKGTFNPRLVTRDRLHRQFSAAVNLATRVPVKRLSYPRRLSILPDVIHTLVTDVRHGGAGWACVG